MALRFVTSEMVPNYSRDPCSLQVPCGAQPALARRGLRGRERRRRGQAAGRRGQVLGAAERRVAPDASGEAILRSPNVSDYITGVLTLARLA